MGDINYLNRPHKPELDECLKQLAEVLKAIGVEELTIEHGFQYHLINEEQIVDENLISDFCSHVAQMHNKILI